MSVAFVYGAEKRKDTGTANQGQSHHKKYI